MYLDFERVEAGFAEDVKREKKHFREDITSTLAGKSILLCEDHPLNAEIARKLLAKVGCEVTWAKNGEEAVAAFCSARPGTFDAVLMDIRMPVMDGLSASRKIRALSREDAGIVPIVAMTANAYEEDIRESREAGMNAHLAKPIDPDKMYETVARLLR